MYKYILTAIIVAIFAGCSAPKPETPPAWYTTLPKDFNFIYARGLGKDVDSAKKKAIASLRVQINNQLDNDFKNNNTKLHIDENQNIDLIIKANERVANTLSMRSVKVDKNEIYKNDTLVLIKLARLHLFKTLEKTSKRKLEANKSKYDSVQDEIAIKRFVVISELMKEYSTLASKVQAKKVALLSYNTYDELNYLNDLRASYIQLKKEITFYILSDVNSRIFTSPIKDAIRATGLILSTNSKTKDSLKLLITSKTTNSQNYSFNQSKSLVKFTSYDVNKKQVSFKQHTFIGKSRKSYAEAKHQSSLHIKGKISKVGIFKFLGIK